MADLPQAKNSNIIPISGSYLSAKNRKKLFERGSFSSFDSSIGGGIIPIRNSKNIEILSTKISSDSSAINSLQEQVANLNARNIQLTSSLSAVNILQNQISILRTSVNNLGSTLQEIGTLINSDSQLEIQKDQQELEIERKLSQRSIREGKESELEKKIQTALLTPVQEVGGRVQGVLGSLMGFFQNLLIGWLTNQGIEALRASFSGNKRKLDDIKNTTISNLALVGGIFSAFKFGIGGIISTISRLSSTVGNLIIGKTISSLFGNLLKFIPGVKLPSPTNPSGGPAGGLGTLFGTGMEALQGNVGETILGGAAFLPGWPGAIAKGAFWGEQLLDAFGNGVIPEGSIQLPNIDIKNLYSIPTNLMDGVKSIQLPDFTNLFKSSTTPINSSTQQSSSSLDTTSQSNQISQSFNIKPQISLSPEMKNVAFSPDNIFSSNSSANYNYNSESLIDFSKSPLYGRVKINIEGQDQQDQINDINKPTLSSIPSKGVQTLPFDIKPEPEPKPTIVYQKSSTKQTGGNNMPLKTGTATNVPIIASSNSDNIYTLYSQTNYNVIV